MSLRPSQQPGIKRTPLEKIDFPDGYTTVTAIAEVPPGGAAGRHTHPGVETGYVLDGEVDLLVDGQPAEHLKAGDSYVIPAGVVHDAKTHGDKLLKNHRHLYLRQDQAAGDAGALMRRTDRPQPGWVRARAGGQRMTRSLHIF